MRIAGLLLVGIFAAACGGSASETPWPVEPDSKALGPAGERGPGAAVDETSPPDTGARTPVHDGGSAPNPPGDK